MADTLFLQLAGLVVILLVAPLVIFFAGWYTREFLGREDECKHQREVRRLNDRINSLLAVEKQLTDQADQELYQPAFLRRPNRDRNGGGRI